MKRIISMLSMALVAVAMMAQQPKITFEKTEHDFGKINEADGRVTTIFNFRNEGMAPLVLSNVRASCGCTTPNWTKEPINPGETGQITVTYNPNGRPGRFQKTITVTSNAEEPSMKLYIKGEVIPKPAQPAPQSYPIKMGALSLKTNNVNFGTIKKGQAVTKEIEYANKTDKDVTVALILPGKGMDGQVTLEVVKPNETGKLVFVFNSNLQKLYGPIEQQAYVVVDGKKLTTADYRITLKAEVVEDFSKMTIAEKQSAPILDIPGTIDFGVVAAGKKNLSKSIAFKNNNANALLIRRIYNANPAILNCAATGTVKANKQGVLTVKLTTIQDGKPMAAGQYSRQITLYTNDPQRSKVNITVKWTIQ
ncbi:MAG: DUF1573 domain-containing protein [Paludibacteraceae bacterium]|nr:DUF1573 domain-containing protein [Paludibacteraceae bacterium]